MGGPHLHRQAPCVSLHLGTVATIFAYLLTCSVEIETCGLNGDDLGALAKKTFVLITTVGPYAQYGEHVSELK